MGDKVIHPDHYNQGEIECIDAMISAYGVEAVKSFCLCNAFKYVWRTRDKNGEEDIKKAQWYLLKYNQLNGQEPTVQEVSQIEGHDEETVHANYGVF